MANVGILNLDDQQFSEVLANAESYLQAQDLALPVQDPRGAQ